MLCPDSIGSYIVFSMEAQWGSRGREFDSRHSDHKSNDFTLEIVGFFCLWADLIWFWPQFWPQCQRFYLVQFVSFRPIFRPKTPRWTTGSHSAEWIPEHGDNTQSSRCRHGLYCLHGLDLVYAEKGPLAAADPRSRRMWKVLLHTGWFSVDDEPAHFSIHANHLRLFPQ